jgi:hypothetical protein
MMRRATRYRAVPRRRQTGQSFIEYLAVTAFAVAVLASGSPSPLAQLSEAIQSYYTDYSFAISIASMPNCTISKSAAGASVTVDICPDLKNPSWPVSFTLP